MFVRTRLHRAATELQHVLARHRWIEVEFPACPVGRDASRRVRREAVPLGLAAEIHTDADVAAAMDVNMAVTVDFQNRERQVDIDGCMRVGAVLDIIGFMERLDAFADEDMEPVRPFPDDLKADQNVPEPGVVPENSTRRGFAR